MKGEEREGKRTKGRKKCIEIRIVESEERAKIGGRGMKKIILKSKKCEDIE